MSLLKVNEVTDLAGGVPEGVGGFTDSETITATDATFSMPALGSPIVKVTVIGGGGGGGGRNNNGTTGGTTTFNAGGAGTVTAVGGVFTSYVGPMQNGPAGSNGLVSQNGGAGGYWSTGGALGGDGMGGVVSVEYLDMTGVSTVNVTIGAGGTGGTGTPTGGAGGNGVVIFEYVAG